MFLYINFEKEHRPTVFFDEKTKSTGYAKKLIKVYKAFVNTCITVNFHIQELHCTYTCINTSVGFMTVHKSSLCEVGDQLIKVHKCMDNIIY